MEPDVAAPVAAPPSALARCPVCHQPVEPTYYFCPNCGTNLHPQPLRTDIATELGIYAFSIILPIMCFLFITKWPGLKYYRSEDPKAKQIGTVAWVLIVLSTVATLYFAYVWTQEAIQSSVDQINTDMSI